jgi:hypothetical protein
MEAYLRLESGSEYVRFIEDGQRFGNGFFEVLQDRFQVTSEVSGSN